ncbi:UDP-glycosyltransferase 92A1 [Prunus yedoensis var. nudiflora]|uniref:UDP-glycosyltransferase 92A1 n=1 Tax=Prunus yedoensis var. nudiflora TaxID=2094558 RepID=A0A314XRZ5_PRUYE|nr:UDP-glycosyltransferase 92A1 [Prunus yedoensis var. nudiflora]
MLVEEMGVSVELTRGAQSKIVGEEVKGVIDLVMNESGKGGEMRKNAAVIKEKIRASIRDDDEEKGSSVKAMDDFVAALLSKRQRIIKIQ